ncbi:MAG: hypothetical protein ACRD03_04010 [Acidimicrobiales bacterium]
MLALASTAFACTIFRGKFVVTGSAGGTVRAVGNDENMSWCAGFPKGTATAPANGGSITVKVAKAKSPCPLSRLPEGKYDIRFFNGAAHTITPDRDWQVDCMGGDDVLVSVRIGGLYVNQYGAGGPKTIALPSNLIPNGPNDESAVCITGSGATFGNQAPLTIL